MIGFNIISNELLSGSIKSIDIDANEYSFLYKFGESITDDMNSKIKEGYLVKVYLNNKSDLYSFDACFIDFQNGMKIVNINHNDIPEFRSKGIPEAIICELSLKLNKPIFSSTNNGFKSYKDEGRVKQATAYWERIKMNFPKNVEWDKENDIYIFKPK